MKLGGNTKMPAAVASLPVRGAWVEMLDIGEVGGENVSRSPCGERGLKCPAG